jgi:hypothetical protein
LMMMRMRMMMMTTLKTINFHNNTTGYYKCAVVLRIPYPLVLTIIIPNKQITTIIIAQQTCRKHNYYFYHCNSQIVFFIIKTRSNSLLEVARHCLHFTRRLHTSYA